MLNLIGGFVLIVIGFEVWIVVLLVKLVVEIIRFRCILVIKVNLKKNKKSLCIVCIKYNKYCLNFKKLDKKKFLKKDIFNSCIVCVIIMEC